MADRGHYLLPRHPDEVNRLDLQHYAFRALWGANHQAPVDAPALVLDIGAGSGRWGWEMTEEFPEALVVGVDLVAGRPGRPDRYQPVRANLLEGLPFREQSFDLVHQRLMFFSIPASLWHTAVHDMMRVTRGGGWVELVEMPMGGFENAGPAVRRLCEPVLAAAAARDLDTSGAAYRSLDDYLRALGCVNVQRREVRCPFGDWGGRVGSFLSTDFRLGSTRLLEAGTSLGDAERTELIQRAMDECEERRVTIPLASAFGQKPG